MFGKSMLLFMVFSLVLLVVPSALAGGANNRDRDFPVMTRNMDAGSDFLYVLNVAQNDPNNFPALVGAITQTYLEMHLSNMAQRADGIAAEIQQTQPLLVALQEVTKLRAGHSTNRPKQCWTINTQRCSRPSPTAACITVRSRSSRMPPSQFLPWMRLSRTSSTCG